MDFNEFIKYAAEYDIVPIYRRIAADLITPASVYLSLRKAGIHSFLLESVEGGENIGRYSFIGVNPYRIISNKGSRIIISGDGDDIISAGSVFDFLQEEFKDKSYASIEELPSFSGGVVGYLGYENISLIENVIHFKDDAINPDSIFGLYKSVLAFDHFKHQAIFITNVHINNSRDLRIQYDEAIKDLSELHEKIFSTNLNYNPSFCLKSDIKVNIQEDKFKDLVLEAKCNITEGDIFQIVLSKRFTAEYSGDLFNVYRALRIINPSPYMYFLELGELTIIGTSPENLVKVIDGYAELLPIAGTRKRGNNKEEDKKLEENLVNDPKEQAEHIMLVDLGRNDLGRVCEYNTINIKQNMQVQRYSHVMHLVSKLEGKLAPGKTSIDALKACFPAGTVTGAPKIRAIQLINDYEPVRRNIYAGAIGYLGYTGNLDMCIAIRTLFARANVIEWQAGAGIVADSIPALESKEINNKSAVMLSALKYAEKINEDINN